MKRVSDINCVLLVQRDLMFPSTLQATNVCPYAEQKIAWLKGEMPAKQCEINTREMKERNGSLFLSCSVVFIATVRDGKCFRSKSLVKCVIEKIMHPRTKEQQEGNLYAHASTYGLKIVPHRHFLRIVYVHYQHLQPVLWS